MDKIRSVRAIFLAALINLAALAAQANPLFIINEQPDSIAWEVTPSGCPLKTTMNHSTHLLSEANEVPFAVTYLEQTHRSQTRCREDGPEQMDGTSDGLALRLHQFKDGVDQALWEFTGKYADAKIEKNALAILSYQHCCGGGTDGEVLELATGKSLLNYRTEIGSSFEYISNVFNAGNQFNLITFASEAQSSYPAQITEHAIGYITLIDRKENDPVIYKSVYALIDPERSKEKNIMLADASLKYSQGNYEIIGNRRNFNNVEDVGVSTTVNFHITRSSKQGDLIIDTTRTTLPENTTLCPFLSGPLDKPVINENAPGCRIIEKTVISSPPIRIER